MNDDATPQTAPPEAAPAAPQPPEGMDVPRAIRYAAFEDLYLEYKFWANPRSQTGLDDTSIKELAESILSGTTSSGENEEEIRTYAGVRVPLEVVMIKSNGGFINLVIDGQRRYRGVETAGLPPDTLIPVYDLEIEPVDWTRELADKYLLRALDAVGTRAGLSSFELSESALRLRSSKDEETGKEFTLAKISRAIGRSESWVSRILSAREHASAKLLHSWKIGEVTDEQFKDLASVKNSARQRADVDAVVKARAAGDKSTARTLAKEQKLVATAAPKPPKADPPAKATKADATKAPPKGKPQAVRGPQATLPIPEQPQPRKPPSFAVIEDFLGMAAKRPPTHDYVKGLMHGAAWASGLLDASKFGKPWQAYLDRVQGSKASKAKPPKGKPAKAKGAKKRR